MDVTLINTFINSFNNCVSMFSGSMAEKQSVSLLTSDLNKDTNINILLGVIGDLYGVVLLSLNRENALKLVSLMVGMQADDLDDVAISALQEILNITSGGAITTFSQTGINADITPPTFVSGDNLDLRLPFPLISVKLKLHNDISFYLNLALKRKTVKKVLIVDDDIEVRKHIFSILKHDTSFDVIGECVDGLDCMKFLKEKQPDILLLDMFMPNMSGASVLVQIYDKYFNMKRVVIDDSNNRDVVQKLSKLGVNAFVAKPINDKSLLLALKKL